MSECSVFHFIYGQCCYIWSAIQRGSDVLTTYGVVFYIYIQLALHYVENAQEN